MHISRPIPKTQFVLNNPVQCDTWGFCRTPRSFDTRHWGVHFKPTRKGILVADLRVVIRSKPLWFIRDSTYSSAPRYLIYPCSCKHFKVYCTRVIHREQWFISSNHPRFFQASKNSHCTCLFATSSNYNSPIIIGDPAWMNDAIIEYSRQRSIEINCI